MSMPSDCAVEQVREEYDIRTGHAEYVDRNGIRRDT